MKRVILKPCFYDDDYQELEKAAERLNCSVEYLLIKFLEEGLFDWSWIEEEAKELEEIREKRKKLDSLIDD